MVAGAGGGSLMASAADGAQSSSTLYSFCGVTLHVAETRFATEYQAGGFRAALNLAFEEDAYGLAVWNSSVVVCRMIELGLLPPITGAVVEVGAGCGLPGQLLASLRGQQGEASSSGGAAPPPPVLLTDCESRVLRNLEVNVELSGNRGRAEVAELDWGLPKKCSALAARGAIDWVIGCDLLYSETDFVFDELVETLLLLAKHGRQPGEEEAHTTNPACRVLLAYERRGRIEQSEGAFLKLARAAGFEVEGPLHLPPEACRWDPIKVPHSPPKDPDQIQVVILSLAPAGPGSSKL